MGVFEVLIPLSFFATVFGVFYIYYTTRNKERMALIEKGMDASVFKDVKSANSTLKLGVLGVGIAIGILMGNILENIMGLNEEVAYFSMIFLFGGCSLIAFHLINRKEQEKY